MTEPKNAALPAARMSHLLTINPDGDDREIIRDPRATIIVKRYKSAETVNVDMNNPDQQTIKKGPDEEHPNIIVQVFPRRRPNPFTAIPLRPRLAF